MQNPGSGIGRMNIEDEGEARDLNPTAVGMSLAPGEGGGHQEDRVSTLPRGWAHWLCCPGAAPGHWGHTKWGKRTRISNWSDMPIELHLWDIDPNERKHVRTYPIPHSGRKKLRCERARQLCGGNDDHISISVMCDLPGHGLVPVTDPISAQHLHMCTEIKIRRKADNSGQFMLLSIKRHDQLTRRTSGSSSGAARRSHHCSSRFSYSNSSNASLTTHRSPSSLGIVSPTSNGGGYNHHNHSNSSASLPTHRSPSNLGIASSSSSSGYHHHHHHQQLQHQPHGPSHSALSPQISATNGDLPPPPTTSSTHRDAAPTEPDLHNSCPEPSPMAEPHSHTYSTSANSYVPMISIPDGFDPPISVVGGGIGIGIGIHNNDAGNDDHDEDNELLGQVME